MTNAELKQALFNKTPVMHNGIRYRRVYEICYRVPEDKLIVSAAGHERHEHYLCCCR